MEPMTPTGQVLRDPFGPVAFYEQQLRRLSDGIAHFQSDFAEAQSPKDRAVSSGLMSKDLLRRAVFSFASGSAIADVQTATEIALTAVARAFSFRVEVEGLLSFMPFHFSTIPTVLNTYAVFAITACTAPSQNTLDEFFTLVTPGDEPEELFDRLARVFAAGRPLAARYPKMQCLPDWTKPVRAALARPAEARAAALGVCMKNWPATMRPFGLKTKPKEWHDLFPYFAFEIALAVCAYDIDDSGFRDHPFYPRELVDHYRKHIRMTRDAARPIGIDPGMPEVVSVRKPRADLTKSKRKGIARWLELVTSGDGDAVDAVIVQVGKPRKVDDIWELLAALTDEVQYALQADVKDDESLAAQAEALAARLGLGEFAPPEDPPAGAARVEEVLRTFDGWLGQRGHQLVAINNDDDAVHAVAVRQAQLQELLDLSGALGIRAKVSAPPFI
jgi:hypothetical protein